MDEVKPRQTEAPEDVEAIAVVLRLLLSILAESIDNPNFQEGNWRESIDKATEFLKARGVEGVVSELLSLPSNQIFYTLDNLSEFEEFLKFKQQKEAEAIHKLSLLQKDILRKIFLETGGHGEVKWSVQELFGLKSPSDRAALSTSLRRLETRGLVQRQATDKREETKRTSVVKLTNLGYRIAKRLTTEL